MTVISVVAVIVSMIVEMVLKTVTIVGLQMMCAIADTAWTAISVTVFTAQIAIGVPFAAVVAAVVTQISVTTAMGECVGVAEIVRLVMMQTYAIADSAWIVISRAVFTALPAIGVPIAAVVLTTNAIVRMVVIVTLVFTMTTVTIAGLTVVIAAVAMTAQWELI